MLISEYLKSPVVKDDPWVKNVCAAKTHEEVATLLQQRFIDPKIYGPGIAHASRHAIEEELPAEIYYHLVIEGHADYDLAGPSVALLMSKIEKKEIDAGTLFLENVFYLIQHLSMDEPGKDLYEWIRANIHDQTKPRALLLDAIMAFAYAQKTEDASLAQFWTSLWEQDNPYWWNVAFLGIRYYDFDKAIQLIPKLIERKCSNATFLLSSMWRVQDDVRMANFLKDGLAKETPWAGLVINQIIGPMKWAEKLKLIDRLYEDKTWALLDEECREYGAF